MKILNWFRKRKKETIYSTDPKDHGFEFFRPSDKTDLKEFNERSIITVSDCKVRHFTLGEVYYADIVKVVKDSIEKDKEFGLKSMI